SPPTSGPSATSIHRCCPGPPCGSSYASARCAARRTAPSSSASSTNCVRRQLQLARPPLDACELYADRRAAPHVQLLRRGVQSGVPDRLGAVYDAQGGLRGALAAADAPLPARRAWQPAV